MRDAPYTVLLGMVLALLSGDILLTSGFMLLRIPPVGPGVPINEAVLAAALGAILLSRQPLAGFADTPIFLPLMPLWVLACLQLAAGVFVGGAWAVRDAANMIETGFVFVGFCLALDQRFSRIFHPWFVGVFTVAALYLLLYPVQDSLVGFSPKISSLSGYDSALFFFFGNPASVGVTAACLLIVHDGKFRVGRLLLTACLMMTLIVFVQARITYLQLAFLFLLVVAFNRRRLISLGVMGAAAVLLMALFLVSGIQLSGRLGQTFSLDFLTNHIQAIWGGGGEATRDAAEGVDLRLGWWLSIHENLQRDLRSWLLGLGYGIPLTSFRSISDDLVREPHNSFVSIYGRLGLVGITAFLAVQVGILRSAVRVIRMAEYWNDRLLHGCAITILCFLGVHLIFSMAEGGFEVSFIAVPYYFLAGVTLAFDQRLRHGAVTQRGSRPASQLRPLAMPARDGRSGAMAPSGVASPGTAE